VTFRLHGAEADRTELEQQLRRCPAAPVPWSVESDGVWQAAAAVDKRVLRDGAVAQVNASQVYGSTEPAALPYNWSIRATLESF
jgi:hypothetical protein